VSVSVSGLSEGVRGKDSTGLGIWVVVSGDGSESDEAGGWEEEVEVWVDVDDEKEENDAVGGGDVGRLPAEGDEPGAGLEEEVGGAEDESDEGEEAEDVEEGGLEEEIDLLLLLLLDNCAAAGASFWPSSDGDLSFSLSFSGEAALVLVFHGTSNISLTASWAASTQRCRRSDPE
jgi:hypothetical protein